MEKIKTIKLKNLGIVSIAMDPQNPRTKFEKKLKKAIPAGEIYQLAMFNDKKTKFKFLDDIAEGKKDVYEISKTTCYCKFFDELNKKGTDPCIKYPNGMETWTFIDRMSIYYLDNEENDVSLYYLLKSSKNFITAQIMERNHVMTQKASREVLDSNF